MVLWWRCRGTLHGQSDKCVKDVDIKKSKFDLTVAEAWPLQECVQLSTEGGQYDAVKMGKVKQTDEFI